MPTYYDFRVNTDDRSVIDSLLRTMHTTASQQNPAFVTVITKPATQRKRNAARAGVAPAAQLEAFPELDAAKEILEHAQGKRDDLKTTIIETVTLTQKDISDAITNLSRKKTLPIAANIVKTTLMSAEGEPEKYAVRVGDIPPSKYAEVYTRIQEALDAVK